jgi:hypothetical protein
MRGRRTMAGSRHLGTTTEKGASGNARLPGTGRSLSTGRSQRRQHPLGRFGSVGALGTASLGQERAVNLSLAGDGWLKQRESLQLELAPHHLLRGPYFQPERECLIPDRGFMTFLFFIEDSIMNPEIFEHRFGNGQSVHYRRLPSGTCYHADTPVPVIELLEQLRQSRRKIRLFYGAPETGQSWHEEHDIIGCIGRSTGSIKVPLLIEPGESGGPALLDHCIIRIDTPRKILYQHAAFRVGDVPWLRVFCKACPGKYGSTMSCMRGFSPNLRPNSIGVSFKDIGLHGVSAG